MSSSIAPKKYHRWFVAAEQLDIGHQWGIAIRKLDPLGFVDWGHAVRFAIDDPPEEVCRALRGLADWIEAKESK